MFSKRRNVTYLSIDKIVNKRFLVRNVIYLSKLAFLQRLINMRKIYFLKTCNTSLRILKNLPTDTFEMQDIKESPISAFQLDEMKNLSGSYEKLFSRRAKKYHQMGLKNQDLSEKDYRRLLLDTYTFLKRPVVILDDQIFIGSSKKNTTALFEATLSA